MQLKFLFKNADVELETAVVDTALARHKNTIKLATVFILQLSVDRDGDGCYDTIS